jgi:hypothetical protein
MKLYTSKDLETILGAVGVDVPSATAKVLKAKDSLVVSSEATKKDISALNSKLTTLRAESVEQAKILKHVEALIKKL